MNSKVLSFVNKLEGYKTAIKELHWDADNMSQHELCDKIADGIAEFQDTVSEVEQSITGKLATGKLKPVSYKVTSLKKFVEDMLDATNTFYKSLEDEGDNYTGMRSDCESFLSEMQRNLYLVNFTMKEDLKRRLSNRINEGYKREENIKTTFHGTKPSTEKGLFKRINDLTKNGQLNTRVFNGIDDAFQFYNKILGSMGELNVIEPNDSIHMVQLNTNNGMTYYGLMRTKNEGDGRCKASITFSPHSDEMEQPDPEMSEPTIDDCNNYEIYGEGRVYRMTGDEFRSLVKESVTKILESDYQYNPMDLNGDSVRAQYAGQIERDENKKKNYQLFMDAFKKLRYEYGVRIGMSGFMKYVEEVEGESLYEKIWEHYGGEYEELADQYLQNVVMPNKKMENKEPTGNIVEKSDIHIKKSKEGTFTAAANKHGESVQGFASKVLNNKENYSPAMVKKANFARNASKWNK